MLRNVCVEEKRKKRNRRENQRWSKNLEMQKKMMHMNNDNKTTTDRMECREREGQDLREVQGKGFHVKGFCIKSFISQARLPDF